MSETPYSPPSDRPGEEPRVDTCSAKIGMSIVCVASGKHPRNAHPER